MRFKTLAIKILRRFNEITAPTKIDISTDSKDSTLNLKDNNVNEMTKRNVLQKESVTKQSSETSEK